jgi:hypothetical protein
MRSVLAILFVGASTLAACTLPGSHYDPSPDAPLTPDAPHVDASAPSIAVSQLSLMVPEGESRMIQVVLSGPPGGAFPVTVSSDNAAVLVAPGTLVFDDANYQVPQLVTLSAPADANSISEIALVTLSNPGVTPTLVTVNVIDDDVEAIVTDAPATLPLSEGTNADVRVHLAAQPSGPVTIQVVSSSPKLGLSLPALTFNPVDYATDKVVRLTAITDPDADNDDAIVTLSAVGLASSVITVHLLDKDVQNIHVAPSTLTLVEGGTAGSLQVSLTKMPSSNVTVTAMSANPEVQLAQSTLVFTPSNYDVAQTIAVIALQDANLVDESTVITFSSAGLTPQTVNVTVQDDDVQKIIESAPPSIVINEGQSTTFTVQLAFAPGGAVTINASAANGNVTLAPVALTFNDSNYATPKTITVTAPLDPDIVNDPDTITLSGVIVAPVSIPVTVIDNTDLGIALSKSVLTIDEGSSQTFLVSLTAQPPSNLTVTVASADTSVATVAPATLTFTPSNWNTPQVVTVAAPHDSNTTDETTMVTVSASGLASKSIQVNTHDTGP